MNAQQKSVAMAVCDGVIRGTILFLLIDFSTSIYNRGPIVNLLTIACLVAFFPAIIFLFLVNRNFKHVISFYLVSQLSFAALLAVIAINYLFISFHMFPQYDISYGEGLSLLVSIPVYIVISELLRLIVGISIFLFHKLMSSK